MRFFEDFQINKDKKVGITNLLSNITTREGSHKGGWARLLKCQLKNMGFENVTILDNKNSLYQFDVIIFDLGAEFSGALNMFGGLDEKVYTRLVEIKNFDGSFYSWRNDIPTILSLSGRRSNASTCEAYKRTEETFLEEVEAKLKTCQTFDHAYKTNKLLIGDSHTPSVWTPEFMIERRDGRTLDGMVKHQTLSRFVRAMPWVKHLHIHCGSIDVRHHWCRTEDPEQSAASAIINLVGGIHDHDDQLETVTLNHTMGIEDESRDLPKTGYYKGTPFFGDWAKRNQVRQIFNEVVDDYTKDCPGWDKVTFPEYFFDESGKLRFEVMEKPQSVHLSPEHYRWNLDANCERWTVLSLAYRIEKDMYGPR